MTAWRYKIMAKAAITKKFALNANGILNIENGIVSIENVDTGELINFSELLSDFADRMVKFGVNYDEDYE